MSEVNFLGADLEKIVFHLHGTLSDCSFAFRKKL
jgi:hypothetical protein